MTHGLKPTGSGLVLRDRLTRNELVLRRATQGLFADSSAIFSPCFKYRYRLDRSLRRTDRSLVPSAKGALAFIMLNPSTANESSNDPTVERCQRRAFQLGYSRLIIANLFAYRATDPRRMKEQPDPVGPDNDLVLGSILREAEDVVCAWGRRGEHLGRSSYVRKMLRNAMAEIPRLHIYHLGDLTKQGEPRHPLYVAYDAPMKTYHLGGQPLKRKDDING